jgi:methionyl-tRNA synthetase
MVGRYRNGVLPAVGEREAIDDSLIARTEEFGRQIAGAYANLELQQCALLPVKLARATNGYIDATAPFSLAKDPAKAARLDTVLNLSAQAITRALVGLLPVLPDKAAEGLRQLNIEVEGKTVADLFRPLVPGHRIGEGKPLFPKVEIATDRPG